MVCSDIKLDPLILIYLDLKAQQSEELLKIEEEKKRGKEKN